MLAASGWKRQRLFADRRFITQRKVIRQLVAALAAIYLAKGNCAVSRGIVVGAAKWQKMLHLYFCTEKLCKTDGAARVHIYMNHVVGRGGQFLP